ncbi:MAG: response regulator [Anaerolineae bacterium]|jgi:two-component system sensor histidine kinase/response regulator|nr:response regulator [Anaerolineae bacterium]
MASDQAATILFVDDNPALLRSVERLLLMEGFNVVLASNGEEALEKLEAAAKSPDLIISDISMPKMDGFEFFEVVRDRREWFDIPFLFLTARDQIDDLRRGYSLGADDYMVKPLDHERLLLIIRSKLKRRGEMLGHIEGQQRALDDAKRELSMMVSHELRTPLVSITMVTDILTREINKMEPEQVKDMLQTMQSGSVRLTRLVEQMVMFVQYQSGALGDAIRAHARPNIIRNAVIGAIDRARQHSYRQREVPLRFDESDPDAQVSGDLMSLTHAFSELLSNAMAFSPPDGEIVITQWVADDMVWITITDQGPGMSEDELATVFQPFHQVNRKQYEQQGVGIGLVLAKGVFEAHDGLLELRSVVDRGTQAIVGLPVWDEADDE